MNDFLAIDTIGGAGVHETMNAARELAKTENKRVIFVFNYCDVFEVYPNGTWECRRMGGGTPVDGPNSEFVPEEGWSAFKNH